jgi:agmatinase
MEAHRLVFADANSTFEEGEFIMFGVPFDGTCSFRKGAALAPRSIREESYNFETYLFEHELDLETIAFHDLGDVKCNSLQDMMGGVGTTVERILNANKFPIIMGGEHSLTPPAVRKFQDTGVVILDAHLDFRNEYLDEFNSHACATRRISELVGIENVISIGIRSMEKKEKEDADGLKLNFVDAHKLKELGIRKVLKSIKWDNVYLSVDMDFFDPSYAPGVGNPEYFGFAPEDAKECINILAPKLIGFDICEASPPFDSGNTCSLAARLIREVIAVVKKANIK